MLICKVWVTLTSTITFTCLWVVMSATGTRSSAFAFAFTTGCVKILIATTIVDSSAFTLTSVVIKIMFRGALVMTTAFTDALFIQNLVWWTLWFWWAFAFAVIKIFDLWFFAKLEPAVTVANGLIKKLWKVTCLFVWTYTLTEFWFKDSRELT